jgi:hypothetical protein
MTLGEVEYYSTRFMTRHRMHGYAVLVAGIRDLEQAAARQLTEVLPVQAADTRGVLGVTLLHEDAVNTRWDACKRIVDTTLEAIPTTQDPIAGAKSVLQLRENAGALGWRLSASDVALLDAAAAALPFNFRGTGFQTADSKFVGYGFERWRLD